MCTTRRVQVGVHQEACAGVHHEVGAGVHHEVRGCRCAPRGVHHEVGAGVHHEVCITRWVQVCTTS